MIRVLVADDHAVVRQGLKMMFELTADIELVAEVVDGEGVLRVLRGETELDLLLMDMNMPGVGGISLIEAVKAYRKKLPILVFSMNTDPQLTVRVIKAGADGYVSKDKDPGILLDAIRKVKGGGKYIDPLVAEQMVLDGLTGMQSPPHTNLSNRELEIFNLLVKGDRISDIADKLAISDKTVSSHKKTLMHKMHFAGMADLMRYAIQRRLFDEPAQD